MQYTKDNPLRVATLCSGYDSQCLALDQLKELFPPFDYKLVLWSEFDPESKTPIDNQPAVIAHKALFPESAHLNYGDMTKIDWEKAPDVDLLFYSTPCLTADSLILTKEGYKKIIDIRVGDVVLTKSGEWHQVAKKFNNGKHPTCFVGGEGIVSIHCTPNHKFWVRRMIRKWDSKTRRTYREFSAPEFVEAKDLDHNCYFGMLLAYGKETRHSYVEDGYIWYPFQKRIDGNIENVYNIEVEEDHSYIVQGCISKNCTDFSNAGLQKGGDEGSGTRSSVLWFTRNAILAKRPKYLIMENVKALVSDKFVKTFRKWEQELASYGYSNYCKVLNAKDNGYPTPIPQNRERIFCVSILNEDQHFHFPEDTELKLRLRDMLEEKVDEKYYLSDDKVQSFVEHCDRKQAEGCGFKFDPTEGGG